VNTMSCAESLFELVAIVMDMLMKSSHGHVYGPDNGHAIHDGAAYCNVQL